jgi:hypothetical protein
VCLHSRAWFLEGITTGARKSPDKNWGFLALFDSKHNHTHTVCGIHLTPFTGMAQEVGDMEATLEKVDQSGQEVDKGRAGIEGKQEGGHAEEEGEDEADGGTGEAEKKEGTGDGMGQGTVQQEAKVQEGGAKEGGGEAAQEQQGEQPGVVEENEETIQAGQRVEAEKQEHKVEGEGRTGAGGTGVRGGAKAEAVERGDGETWDLAAACGPQPDGSFVFPPRFKETRKKAGATPHAVNWDTTAGKVSLMNTFEWTTLKVKRTQKIQAHTTGLWEGCVVDAKCKQGFGPVNVTTRGILLLVFTGRGGWTGNGKKHCLVFIVDQAEIDKDALQEGALNDAARYIYASQHQTKFVSDGVAGIWNTLAASAGDNKVAWVSKIVSAYERTEPILRNKLAPPTTGYGSANTGGRRSSARVVIGEEKEVVALREQVRALKTGGEELAEQLRQKDRQITTLQQQVSDLKQELADGETARTPKTCKGRCRSSTRLQGKVDDLNDKVEELEEQLKETVARSKGRKNNLKQGRPSASDPEMLSAVTDNMVKLAQAFIPRVDLVTLAHGHAPTPSPPKPPSSKKRRRSRSPATPQPRRGARSSRRSSRSRSRSRSKAGSRSRSRSRERSRDKGRKRRGRGQTKGKRSRRARSRSKSPRQSLDYSESEYSD